MRRVQSSRDHRAMTISPQRTSELSHNVRISDAIPGYVSLPQSYSAPNTRCQALHTAARECVEDSPTADQHSSMVWYGMAWYALTIRYILYIRVCTIQYGTGMYVGMYVCTFTCFQYFQSRPNPRETTQRELGYHTYLDRSLGARWKRLRQSIIPERPDSSPVVLVVLCCVKRDRRHTSPADCKLSKKRIGHNIRWPGCQHCSKLFPCSVLYRLSTTIDFSQCVSFSPSSLPSPLP